MRVVCISDTHSCHRRLTIPDGDLLIHSGDATNRGTVEELGDFRGWMAKLPHRHKVFVAGNHDHKLDAWGPEKAKDYFKYAGVHYLDGTTYEADGWLVWGSPYTPEFWGSFQMNQAEAPTILATMPEEANIVVTHGPAYGILDVAHGEALGCQELYDRLVTVSPDLHVHGHIHEGYGEAHGRWHTVNAALADWDFKLPIVVDL